MSAPYYNSPLLDELHTTFPAILYSPENFQSVPDLLRYVQRQVRRRYDLFTRGREQYLREHGLNRVPNIASIPIRRETVLAHDILNEILLPHMAQAQAPAPQVDIGSQLLGMLFQHQDDRVIIRPTQITIDEKTEVISAIERGDCSICQDSYEVGASVRKIRHCQHAFHVACIDRWFTTDVRCPMCRHDIRAST
jgi:hypothetical protein